MWLIRFAMRRPISLMVVVCGIVLMSVLAISRMKIDIFPDMNLPVIYVVQPYGGMDPAQMEGYMVQFYEQHFLYISGIDHIESQSIQGASVMKIYFQPGCDMAAGMAQTVAQVQRAKSYMPPGTVAPFILRYDAGNVPVGYLVFDSPTRSVGEIQDLAFVRVRPKVSTIPGASTPPPFGGNQRTIVITLNPERLRAYGMAPDEVVKHLEGDNVIIPSGIVRIGDKQFTSTVNSVIGPIEHYLRIPVKQGAGPTIFLGDIGSVQDSTDIPTGYALVNGKPAVYIAISKRSDASTLSVVNAVKAALPGMQELLPEDLKIKWEFDQSIYVTDAIQGVLKEGATGAFLTGFVVLLFLRDWRSALVVVMNIPFALLSSVVALALCGQTINIMTLGGLALAVGILVDEATVAIENIHSHLATGAPLLTAIYDACLEVTTPRLLSMLSVVSVFMPSFFMVGSTQALFVPLSLAVGFAMVASYLLSNTFVPVMCAWILKAPKPGEHHDENAGLMGRLKMGYEGLLRKLMPIKGPAIIAYLCISSIAICTIFPALATEIFPTGNPNGFRIRLRAPQGTRIEKTQEIAQQALATIADVTGKNKIKGTIGYVGVQPPMYAISNVYMWTSGPQEAVLLVELADNANINVAQLKEKLRKKLPEALPGTTFTFEAGDIVSQIMNFGAQTPIEVDINGPHFDRDQEYAAKLLEKMKQMPDLRDCCIVQPLQYPCLNIDIDRVRAGQLGVTAEDIGKALISATYSSRFISPVYWRDANSGMAYQVQMQVPQDKMVAIKDVENVPVMRTGKPEVYIRDIATVTQGTMIGEYDRYNMQRQVSITANLAGDDLGRAAKHVDEAIKALGKPPRGVRVNMRGQVPSMRSTLDSLGSGLGFAVVAILLMLVCYFQSIPLSFVVISVVPAIVTGVLVMLALTGTSVNIQSFMGAIMSIGVGVANSILVVVFQEHKRFAGDTIEQAAIEGAGSRLRPVMMTAIAMIAGMIPMALGLGEGGDRQAPLGRAVIGGLLASSFAVLFILPMIFAFVQRKATVKSPSVLPEDVYVIQSGTHTAPTAAALPAVPLQAPEEHPAATDSEV